MDNEDNEKKDNDNYSINELADKIENLEHNLNRDVRFARSYLEHRLQESEQSVQESERSLGKKCDSIEQVVEKIITRAFYVFVCIIILACIDKCDHKKETKVTIKDVSESVESVDARVRNNVEGIHKIEQNVKKIYDNVKKEDVGSLQEKIDRVTRQQSGEKVFPKLTIDQFKLLWNYKDICGIFYYRDILKKTYPENSELMLLEEEINKIAKQRSGKRVYPDLTDEQIDYFWNLKNEYGMFIYRNIMRSQDKYMNYTKFMERIDSLKDSLLRGKLPELTQNEFKRLVNDKDVGDILEMWRRSGRI